MVPKSPVLDQTRVAIVLGSHPSEAARPRNLQRNPKPSAAELSFSKVSATSGMSALALIALTHASAVTHWLHSFFPKSLNLRAFGRLERTFADFGVAVFIVDSKDEGVAVLLSLAALLS